MLCELCEAAWGGETFTFRRDFLPVSQTTIRRTLRFFRLKWKTTRICVVCFIFQKEGEDCKMPCTVCAQNFLSYIHVVLLNRSAVHYYILLMCIMPCPTHDFIGTLIMCPFYVAHALKYPVKWAESKKDGNKWKRHALWTWYVYWPVWMSFWVTTIGYLLKIHVTAWVWGDRSFKQPVSTWSCLVYSFVPRTLSLLL